MLFPFSQNYIIPVLSSRIKELPAISISLLQLYQTFLPQEAYSEPNQTSKMKLFAKIVHG